VPAEAPPQAWLEEEKKGGEGLSFNAPSPRRSKAEYANVVADCPGSNGEDPREMQSATAGDMVIRRRMGGWPWDISGSSLQVAGCRKSWAV